MKIRIAWVLLLVVSLMELSACVAQTQTRVAEVPPKNEREEEMAFEYLVGLEVGDDALYTQYRAAMSPILEEYGGGFRYDFRVSEVLKSETDNKINRLFCIYFPDEAAKDAFFGDERYAKVKDEFFTPSVVSTTIISGYDRPE